MDSQAQLTQARGRGRRRTQSSAIESPIASISQRIGGAGRAHLEPPGLALIAGGPCANRTLADTQTAAS